ncbi:MAG: DUF3467 domain-containing protein [Endomicrobiales bacterium]|nr:DUF3467 domain-containing protein [Endomicrobiales bacterium]
MEEMQKNEIQIEIDDATAQGAYSNLALISHTENEFIVDFIFIQPRAPKSKVRSRVITSPGHVKRLIAALQENVTRYEARFGEIKLAAAPEGDKKIGFYN